MILLIYFFINSFFQIKNLSFPLHISKSDLQVSMLHLSLLGLFNLRISFLLDYYKIFYFTLPIPSSYPQHRNFEIQQLYYHEPSHLYHFKHCFSKDWKVHTKITWIPYFETIFTDLRFLSIDWQILPTYQVIGDDN